MKKRELLNIIEDLKRQIAEKDEFIESQKRKILSYEQYKEENQIMRSEQIVAEQIQLSMLPTAYPAFEGRPHIDLYADMDAACEVGGDFYDYFSVDADHICFGIADVMGKGIPAAMHMAVTKTMIKMRLMSGESPGEVFSEINRLLCADSRNREKQAFITAWTAVMDVNTNILTCVNAGHTSPVLKRKGKAARLVKTRSGIPLAAYYSKKHSAVYKEFELKLEKGDILLLYTDGITETINEKNKDDKFFGTGRLLDAVDLYMSDPHSMKELTAYIRRQVIAFSNHAGQDDDITLLALQIN